MGSGSCVKLPDIKPVDGALPVAMCVHPISDVSLWCSVLAAVLLFVLSEFLLCGRLYSRPYNGLHSVRLFVRPSICSIAVIDLRVAGCSFCRHKIYFYQFN